MDKVLRVRSRRLVDWSPLYSFSTAPRSLFGGTGSRCQKLHLASNCLRTFAAIITTTAAVLMIVVGTQTNERNWAADMSGAFKEVLVLGNLMAFLVASVCIGSTWVGFQTVKAVKTGSPESYVHETWTQRVAILGSCVCMGGLSYTVATANTYFCSPDWKLLRQSTSTDLLDDACRLRVPAIAALVCCGVLFVACLIPALFWVARVWRFYQVCSYVRFSVGCGILFAGIFLHQFSRRLHNLSVESELRLPSEMSDVLYLISEIILPVTITNTIFAVLAASYSLLACWTRSRFYTGWDIGVSFVMIFLHAACVVIFFWLYELFQIFCNYEDFYGTTNHLVEYMCHRAKTPLFEAASIFSIAVVLALVDFIFTAVIFIRKSPPEWLLKKRLLSTRNGVL